MKLIKRYTAGVQELIGSKTRPEPWLHIVIVPTSSINKFNFDYAIYVWDTRQVLEEGSGSTKNHYVFEKFHNAADNREPLQGCKNAKIAKQMLNNPAKAEHDAWRERNIMPQEDLDFEKHKGMSILRYTPQIQKTIGSSCKAEPWLHIAFFMLRNKGQAYYAIYVWDTRKIVSEGQCTASKADKASEHSEYATDNHKPLLGNSEGAQRFNYSVYKSI